MDSIEKEMELGARVNSEADSPTGLRIILSYFWTIVLTNKF